MLRRAQEHSTLRGDARVYVEIDVVTLIHPSRNRTRKSHGITAAGERQLLWTRENIDLIAHPRAGKLRQGHP
jgi:hypothetical protein